MLAGVLSRCAPRFGCGGAGHSTVNAWTLHMSAHPQRPATSTEPRMLQRRRPLLMTPSASYHTTASMCRSPAAAATATVGAQVHAETVSVDRPLALEMGGHIDNVQVSYASYGDASKPVVYIMPSMSHSAHVAAGSSDAAGWWEKVVGYGPDFGIDLNRYRVVCAAALGAPYGTTSPIASAPSQRGVHFPVVTPADQATVHAHVLDLLGIDKVHAVVGGSMGGMQVLQFAAQFPDRYDRVVAMATTAKTSPSTVALRSVQRAVVMMDPKYNGGHYAQEDPPLAGMGVARQIGTIAYRSRSEFDTRFHWTAEMVPATQSTIAGLLATASAATENEPQPQSSSPSPKVSSVSPCCDTEAIASGALCLPEFEVERYLAHQAHRFRARYDANCYLLLSRCMDLMDLGRGQSSFEAGVARIPSTKEVMLLSIDQDSLIPAAELEYLASVLGAQGTAVHYECLSSLHGHDAFLTSPFLFNPRLSHFLQEPRGVTGVRGYLNSIL